MEARLESPQEFSSQYTDLREFELVVQEGIPESFAYLVEFTLGQVCYFAGELERALHYLGSAGDKLEALAEKDAGYAASQAPLHLYSGNAYYLWHLGERAENLEQAIAHHGQALEVYTRTAFPQDWARTQNNLAWAHALRGADYADKGERDQAKAEVRQAMELVQDGEMRATLEELLKMVEE